MDTKNFKIGQTVTVSGEKVQIIGFDYHEKFRIVIALLSNGDWADLKDLR